MDWRAFEPLIAVCVPLAASILIAAAGRNAAWRNGWTAFSAVALWIFVAHLAHGVFTNAAPAFASVPLAPGLDLRFAPDRFGLMFALVTSTLWLATAPYAIGYARATGMQHRNRFFALFSLCIGSAVGIALSANLLTLLICYEVLTFATYPLVVHNGTVRARHAGRLYLAFALPAGVCLVAATAWIFFAAGSLDFKAGGMVPGMSSAHVTGLFLLMALGFGVKAAIMPLHPWLPEAMIAPTPVSALLHAVAVVKAGVFGYLRLIYFIIGPEQMRAAHLWEPLAALAGFTLLAASLIALRQDELKRRLAYSTIGHLAYIVLGAALLVPSAQIGSLMHLANHAMMKITLFFCAGSIYAAAHKERVSQLHGLGWRMPWTFASFGIGALGLSGMPLVCGFISKWWLVRGAMDAGEPVYAGLLLLSGLLNLAYLLPVVTAGFDPRLRSHRAIREAPALMTAPLVATALLSLAFGAIVPLISAEAEQLYQAVAGGWAQ